VVIDYLEELINWLKVGIDYIKPIIGRLKIAARY